MSSPETQESFVNVGTEHDRPLPQSARRFHAPPDFFHQPLGKTRLGQHDVGARTLGAQQVRRIGVAGDDDDGG